MLLLLLLPSSKQVELVRQLTDNHILASRVSSELRVALAAGVQFELQRCDFLDHLLLRCFHLENHCFNGPLLFCHCFAHSPMRMSGVLGELFLFVFQPLHTLMCPRHPVQV